MRPPVKIGCTILPPTDQTVCGSESNLSSWGLTQPNNPVREMRGSSPPSRRQSRRSPIAATPPLPARPGAAPASLRDAGWHFGRQRLFGKRGPPWNRTGTTPEEQAYHGFLVRDQPLSVQLDRDRIGQLGLGLRHLDPVGNPAQLAALEQIDRFLPGGDGLAGDFQLLIQASQREVRVGDAGDHADDGAALGELGGEELGLGGFLLAPHPAEEIELPGKNAIEEEPVGYPGLIEGIGVGASDLRSIGAALGGDLGPERRPRHLGDRARFLYPGDGDAEVVVVLDSFMDQGLQRVVSEDLPPGDVSDDGRGRVELGEESGE